MPLGPAFICAACKRSPGVLGINGILTPLLCLQVPRALIASAVSGGEAVATTVPAGRGCPLPRVPASPLAADTPGRSQNPSLPVGARRPVVRAVADCTRVLASERTHCYAGDFIKSLKDTSLIAPETSTFHVAGAARCAVPGNGPDSPPGSKPSAF